METNCSTSSITFNHGANIIASFCSFTPTQSAHVGRLNLSDTSARIPVFPKPFNGGLQKYIETLRHKILFIIFRQREIISKSNISIQMLS